MTGPDELDDVSHKWRALNLAFLDFLESLRAARAAGFYQHEIAEAIPRTTTKSWTGRTVTAGKGKVARWLTGQYGVHLTPDEARHITEGE